ncbi:MAG: biotin--[acetyl-CoA-carboxylase] ligase [Bifidobacteriaceae bacterium]|jgi:BirA family biotin operon repressor/biotin-[acetyl-CoA-carboxylase] ligase|nr:biotin--[acetyl-CoA-carboxylase] ligase [Bifidobacteriaceae bacterium]
MRPPLDLTRLGEALVAQGPYERVDVVDQIDSTNAELLRQAAAADTGPERPVALLAEHQTQGRGRHHPGEPRPRPWLAPPRTSVIASVLVRTPSIAALNRSLLGLAFGLAVVEALDLAVGGRPGLKWPNDVVLDGRKLAGLLASVTPRGDVVIGIGLNVHQSEDELPDRRAGSLATLGLPQADRTGMAIAVLSSAATWYDRWARGDRRLLDRIASRMVTLGQTVRIEQPGGRVVAGQAGGLAADGGLRLRQADGSEQAVNAGEVL